MTDVEEPPASPYYHANKRVSFGDGPVQTILYEEDESPSPAIYQPPPFTAAEAPVSRVKVTAATASSNEFGHPIRPPEEVRDVRHVTISPPLPSLAKRMENEHENPFRPEEDLYHEVDPIVEAYLHRRVPSSQPGSANGSPLKTPPNVVQNGVRDEAKTPTSRKTRQESPVKETNETKQQTRRTSSQTATGGGGGGASERDALDDDLPKAGTVELIHIKKKKCGCCSVQ